MMTEALLFGMIVFCLRTGTYAHMNQNIKKAVGAVTDEMDVIFAERAQLLTAFKNEVQTKEVRA